MRFFILVTAVLFAGFTGLQAHAQTDDAPKVLVHYMPWYQAKPYASSWGWHWTMNHFNPDRPDAEGRRPISSHFYPSIGPYDSRDPDVLEYHTLLMKVSGIDGVIVDWYGTANLYDYPMLHDATRRLFKQVREAGLQFAICYEDRSVQAQIDAGRLTHAQAIEHAQEQIQYVQDNWMNQPEYVTLDGRPLLLNFGPLYFKSSSQWEQIFSGLTVDPQFFPEDHRIAPVAEGAFPWPPMWASGGGTLSLSRVHQYLDEFYARARSWPAVVGSAFPGFHDVYAEAGIGASYGYLDAQDGRTFRETFQRALDAHAPIVQLVTWNDFGEGTNIEPTEEYGLRYLQHVQETVAGLRALPYGAADLELPGLLYALRKQYKFDTAMRPRLDEAAAHLVEGRPADARRILAAASSTEDSDRPTGQVRLHGYPNPATSAVTFVVDLPHHGDVRLEVFDLLGRHITTLAQGPLPAGRHTFAWAAGDQPAGAYLYRLQRGDEVTTRTLMLQ